MKRTFIVLCMQLAYMGAASAEHLSVEAISIPQGRKASLVIQYHFAEEDVYSGYQFRIELPEGITTVSDGEGQPAYTAGECHDGGAYSITIRDDNGSVGIVAYSTSSTPLKGTGGILLSIPIQCSETLPVGTYEAEITGIQFGNKDGVNTTFMDDVAFTVTVASPDTPDVILDETSTALPEASGGEVLIKVKRTIKAGEWSTLCLPFSMTEAQVYEAFGEDVQLMEFIEYEKDDNLTSICVVFDEAYLAEDGFFANYPYIIRTTKDISYFTVTSTIDPDEENAIAEYTNGRTGSRKEVYGTFYGTLKSGTTVPENSLFLNANKFYYSAGNTPIMGFRGYFDFVAVLSSVDNAASAVTLRIGEETTSLEALQKGCAADGKVYDLQGRMIENPGKGIYIKNNKKIIIK